MGSMADFVKPMVYLKTNAPAGVPYEIQALGAEMAERISKLPGGDAGVQWTQRLNKFVC